MRISYIFSLFFFFKLFAVYQISIAWAHLLIKILELPENIIYWKICKFFKVRKDKFLNILNPINIEKYRLKGNSRPNSPTCCSEQVSLDHVAQGFIQLDVENLPLLSISFKNWKVIRILKTLSLQVTASSSVIKFNWQTKPPELHQWSWVVPLWNGELSFTDVLFLE